jgi:hypothetical protein
MQNVIPQRIVLSRKGFDKSAGGFASPIFSDGRMVSLPIPENDRYQEVTLRFDDLGDPNDQYTGISSIIRRLPRPFDVARRVHLDPDVRPDLRPKNRADPTGYFGQEDKAMRQLQNQGVCDPQNNSLFLFYGWFKGVRVVRDGRLHEETPSLRQPRTHHQHVIWGWLQVEDKPRLIPRGEVAQDLAHIDYHPHIEARYRRTNNYIFVSRKTLSFAENIAGAGVFSRYDDQVLRLTCEDEVTRAANGSYLHSCGNVLAAELRRHDGGLMAAASGSDGSDLDKSSSSTPRAARMPRLSGLQISFK